MTAGDFFSNSSSNLNKALVNSWDLSFTQSVYPFNQLLSFELIQGPAEVVI